MVGDLTLINWFSYHAPTIEQQVAYSLVREKALEFARLLDEYLPDSADKTATFRKLRETVMSANQTIACNPKEEQ